MRYIAAAALHQKALQILSVIEDAEERMKGMKDGIAFFGLVTANWREELSIFPCGKPSAAEQERAKQNLETTKAAHARLCAYYGRILSRLIDLQ
jgi:hypothetical protein